MRIDRRAMYGYRAAFGAGFIVLGIVTLWRIARVDAPAGNKVLGVMLAVAMIALGVVRLVQFARRPRGTPP